VLTVCGKRVLVWLNGWVDGWVGCSDPVVMLGCWVRGIRWIPVCVCMEEVQGAPPGLQPRTPCNILPFPPPPPKELPHAAQLLGYGLGVGCGWCRVVGLCWSHELCV
jgi:hypothetical protein